MQIGANIDDTESTIISGFNTVNNKTDTLTTKANTLINIMNQINSTTQAIDGKANQIRRDISTLNNKADTLQNAASTLVTNTMGSQSLGTGPNALIGFFILSTLYGNRVTPQSTVIWVGSVQAIPISGAPETIIPGVQKVELDRQSIPAGSSMPMTVDVSVSPGNDCSAITMIQEVIPKAQFFRIGNRAVIPAWNAWICLSHGWQTFAPFQYSGWFTFIISRGFLRSD